MVKVELKGAESFFNGCGPDYALAEQAHRTLWEKTGKGAEFTGWTELPARVKETELAPIEAAARLIRGRSRALVVIGIGGSYLGARGAIELLRPVASEEDVRVLFAGNTLSADALCDTLELLGDDDFDVNVISKSGTTLEPAVAFRIFRELLEKKHGDQADKHIFATTDARRGALKRQAEKRGWPCFVVPDDVGGRFSIFSAVGLLPMAVAGIDIKRVLDAAIKELAALSEYSPENPAWQYAAARQRLCALGHSTEILACYEPSFRFMAEWWKQLYGESEGKEGKGIFPASVEFTADLHSMGQYIQQGPRMLMETVVRFTESRRAFPFPADAADADGLNYLKGRDLADICRVAADAVEQAHIQGGVPCMRVEIPKRNEEGLAALVCFFETACAISGYMSGVNPFDQPGVEAYKKNMFRMLGKPEV